MNGQEIIEMAKQAGFVIHTHKPSLITVENEETWVCVNKELEAFAKLVAAKYETALVDYINHVGYCEGTDFISDIDWVENKTSVEIIKAAAIQARTKWKE
jgi:hypothetical protein